MEEPTVVIVGSGVVGLTTALVLAENALTSKIVIIAENLPDDSTYTATFASPWAGAHFRPFPSTLKAQLFESKLTRITQNYFRKLSESHPESSIRFVNAIEYIESASSLYKNTGLGYTEGVLNFKKVLQEELPSGFEFGSTYSTWVLNAPLYIQFLQRMLKFEFKVKFIKAKLAALKEVNKYVSGKPIIINCTGRGLRYNGGYDPETFPIRGQTLLINPPVENHYSDKTVTYQLKNGEWIFNIPRPLNGGVIIGGTKQVNETFGNSRSSDTHRLIENATKYFPDLMRTNEHGEKYFDIVRINVGLRPARKGGLNVKVEREDDNVIINAYGAGGMGFELSYGIATYVHKNLLDILTGKPKL